MDSFKVTPRVKTLDEVPGTPVHTALTHCATVCIVQPSLHFKHFSPFASVLQSPFNAHLLC